MTWRITPSYDPFKVADATLDLRFAENKSLVNIVTGTSPVTFTRASTATYVGSDGLIKSAAVNQPRFDHNPTTGASLGLLVEEQRTNLLLHNRTLTNAAWSTASITAAKDQVGVDGASNSASSITATAGNGTILQAVTSASAARAASAYVRRITGTGTVEMTQNGGTTWTAVTVTGSWTRVTIPSATVTNPSVGFRIVTSGDAIAVDYVQLETGAFSTSAIETTTATVTRSADVASITGTNFSSFFNAASGTAYAATNLVSNIGGVFGFDDGGTSNEWRASISALFAFQVRAAGVDEFLPADGGLPAFGLNKLVLAVEANNATSAANGSVITADNTLNVPTGLNRLCIGVQRAGANWRNGTISRLTYWPTRLPNAVLQAITR